MAEKKIKIDRLKKLKFSYFSINLNINVFLLLIQYNFLFKKIHKN